MSHQLWLRMDRDRVTERGFGITHTPGDVVEILHGDFEIEPVSGFACAKPDYSLEAPLDWTYQYGAFVEVAPFAGDPGDESDLPWPTVWSHRETGNFEFETVELPAGAGFVFRFITYDGGQPCELTRGPIRVGIAEGRLTLHLNGERAADLQMWEAEEWHSQPHYLAVYAVGRRIVARRLGPTDRHIAGWLPIPEDETPPLPAGPVTLTGSDYLTFGIWPERHRTTLDIESDPIALPEPSSTGTFALLSQLSPLMEEGPAIDVTRLDADGAEVTGDAVASEPHEQVRAQAVRYKVSATLASAEGANLYITRVRVKLPRKVENDGQVAVDLLAATDLPPTPGWLRAPKVEEQRSLDPESCTIAFDLVADRDMLGPWVQPNMKGSFRLAVPAHEPHQQVGATPEEEPAEPEEPPAEPQEPAPTAEQRAEFYTSRPSRVPQTSHETLRIEAELGWKRFREAKWPGEFTVAGMRLSEAYRRVAEVAGLADEQMVIAAGTDYELPRERADGQPLFDFQPGQPIAEILAYLRDHFSMRDLLRYAPDGLFHADPRPQAAGGTVFELSAYDPADPASRQAFLQAAGQPTDRPFIFRGTWQERFDETGFANEVEVVGMADDGSPLAAIATDWPSVRDPQTQVGEDESGDPIYVSTFNYIGEFRRMVIIDAGLTTQALVNWVCRTTLARVRLLPVVAECEGSFVPDLLEGDIVEIAGRGLWRVRDMKTSWTRDWPAGRTQYGLEHWSLEPHQQVGATEVG